MSMDIWEGLNKKEVLEWAQKKYKGYALNQNLMAQLYRKKVLGQKITTPSALVPVNQLKEGKYSRIKVLVADVVPRATYIGCANEVETQYGKRMCMRKIIDGACPVCGEGLPQKEFQIISALVGDENDSIEAVFFPSTVQRYLDKINEMQDKIAVLEGRKDDRGQFIVRRVVEIEGLAENTEEPVAQTNNISVSDNEIENIVNTIKKIVGVNSYNITLKELEDYLREIKVIDKVSPQKLILRLGAKVVEKDGKSYIVVERT